MNIKSNIKTASLALLLSFCVTFPVYSAPAVVNSDSQLNISSTLSPQLTRISNESGLDITFYSTNLVSDNNAAKLNDELVKTLPGTNYISIILNKGIKTTNTISVNVGPDFREFISNEEISKNIVIPNRTKYLPAKPTQFITSVSSDLVKTVKERKDSKQFYSFLARTIIIIISASGSILLIIIVIKAVSKHSKSTRQIQEELQKEFVYCCDLYTKVLNDSSILSGYEGLTADKANELNEKIIDLQKEYNGLQTNYSTLNYKSVFFLKHYDYRESLKVFKNKLESINSELKHFTSLLLSVKEQTKDPLGVIDQIEKREKETKYANSIKEKVESLYKSQSLLKESPIHSLYLAVKVATEPADIEAKFVAFNTAFIQETKQIISFNRVKSSLKFIYDYINNNKNLYYEYCISDEMKTLSREAYYLSINWLNYNDINYFIKSLDTLEEYLEPFYKADKLYAEFVSKKDKLIKRINNLILLDKNEKDLLFERVYRLSFTSSSKYECNYLSELNKIERDIDSIYKRKEESVVIVNNTSYGSVNIVNSSYSNVIIDNSSYNRSTSNSSYNDYSSNSSYDDYSNNNSTSDSYSDSNSTSDSYSDTSSTIDDW